MSEQKTNVDIDGDGKPDITVTAIKPVVVDGTEQVKGDIIAEFQQQKADVHYKIIIPSTNDPNEVKRVFVGVNGVPYTILRDIPVIVPRCVVTTLADAKETRYRDSKQVGPLGNKLKEPYEAQSYPVQILAEVPVKKIAAEQKKIDEEFGL